MKADRPSGALQRSRSRSPHILAAPALVAMAVAMMMGCSAYPRLTRPPAAPPAEAEWVAGRGGVRLYLKVVPPEGAVRGVVWFVPGAEIGSAPPYPRFTQALFRRGFVTAQSHPRGTGYSDGLRGDIDDYAAFLQDYDLFLAELIGRFPDTPLFLMGHSAGAAFALHVAARTSASVTGVILVNPAYKMSYTEGMGPSWRDYVVYASNYLFRSSAITVDMNARPDGIGFAADREEALAMRRDPFVVRYFSMRYLFAQKKVMDRCAENAAKVAAPMLLVQGAHDDLVNPGGNDEILLATRAQDKRKMIATEGGHGSSAVESLVTPLMQWLDGHLAPPR